MRKIIKKKKILKKTSKKTSLETSSDDNDLVLAPLCGRAESDCDLRDNKIVKGDFAMVNVWGKSKAVKYIARIDSFDSNKYEVVFLKKV